MNHSIDELKSIDPQPITLEDLQLVESRTLSPIISSSNDPPSPIKYSQEEKQENRRIWRISMIKKIIPYFIKIQKYSAYSMMGFLGIHLTSVIVIPGLGIPIKICQEFFEMGRNIYHGIPCFEETMIIGMSFIHVLSGISLRFLRNRLNSDKQIMNKTKQQNHNHNHNQISNGETIIHDDRRDDIGLGGITGLIGLGYRKSKISMIWPNMNPLQFSGYLLIPLVGYHFLKFRQIPIWIDDDSSLINLNYISYVLNKSPLSGSMMTKIGKSFNWMMLIGLCWNGMYHFTSGWLKIGKKFSINWKKLAYLIINGITLLGIISLSRLSKLKINESGFLGKLFMKYINALYI